MAAERLRPGFGKAATGDKNGGRRRGGPKARRAIARVRDKVWLGARETFASQPEFLRLDQSFDPVAKGSAVVRLAFELFVVNRPSQYELEQFLDRFGVGCGGIQARPGFQSVPRR